MKTFENLIEGQSVKVNTHTGVVNGLVTGFITRCGNDTAKILTVKFNYEGSGYSSIEYKFSKKTGKKIAPKDENQNKTYLVH